MDDNEHERKCKDCGTEYKKNDGKCPKCGSSDILIKQPVGGGTVSIKGSLGITHEFRWSATAWAILGIVITLWAAIFFGLGSLNTLDWWVNILLSLCIVAFLFVIIWLARIKINNLLNWVESRFTGKKKYPPK